MDHVILLVSYDPALVTPQFMAEHVWELEGIKNIKLKDGD